jgi:hypothetical protein
MYGDELELCHWAAANRYMVAMATHSMVFHKHARASHGMGSSLSAYYGTRNNLRIGRASLRGFLRLLFDLYYPAFKVALALRDLLRGHAGFARAIAEGLLDGYRGRTGQWARHNAVATKSE